MNDECIYKANSAVVVIVVKKNTIISDLEATKIAIDLLKRE